MKPKKREIERKTNLTAFSVPVHMIASLLMIAAFKIGH